MREIIFLVSMLLATLAGKFFAGLIEESILVAYLLMTFGAIAMSADRSPTAKFLIALTIMFGLSTLVCYIVPLDPLIFVYVVIIILPLTWVTWTMFRKMSGNNFDINAKNKLLEKA